jgi:flavin-dependent dehydrogenase
VTQVDATAKARVTASDRADVLVVGASFAGVACAIGAARAGLHVILVERKTDAGEKLHTTGIVVKEAADEIERLGQFPPELIRPIRGVRLYGSKLASVALDSPGYFFLATDTPNLMRWLIDAFLEKLAHAFDFASMNVVARRAGLIPVGAPVVPIAGDRALLVGDAAGLVSPLTAGGIHTALESGRAAAVAITAALARDTGSAMTVTIDVPQLRTKRLLGEKARAPVSSEVHRPRISSAKWSWKSNCVWLT